LRGVYPGKEVVVDMKEGGGEAEGVDGPDEGRGGYEETGTRGDEDEVSFEDEEAEGKGWARGVRGKDGESRGREEKAEEEAMLERRMPLEGKTKDEKRREGKFKARRTSSLQTVITLRINLQ